MPHISDSEKTSKVDVPLSAEFTKAAEEVKTLKSQPTNDEKLALYGLYKVGNGHTSYAQKEEKKNLGFVDFTRKAQNGAWEKALKETADPADAQKKYIAKVAELKTKYGTA